ncbi:MAG: NUDIX hydrolase [Candidatus Uhrbacteria bacterium]|nr:NUDIX hydrolase [Candidatus Uhrbacteria bacterium]
MPNERNRFSSCCGVAFAQTKTWPRVCQECGNPFWDNPIPVMVVLQPVIRKDGKVGLALVRRGIKPCIGEIALAGGYLEIENWRTGAARELDEEGVAITDPTTLEPFRPYPYESATGHRSLLCFCLAGAIHEKDLAPFVPNSEVLERVIVYEAVEACFSTHTEAIRQFFLSQPA